MNEVFAIITVTGMNNDAMDEGLMQVTESVDKAVKIERYLGQKYGLRLSNEDFEHIFDIIHN